MKLPPSDKRARLNSSELSRDKKLRLRVRSERSHLQVVTNRKRSLYLEMVDDKVAWLTLETEIVCTTMQHRCQGKLRSRNSTMNRANNLGHVSRYVCTDLVKLIYIKDMPQIMHDFESGKALEDIKFSSWPMLVTNSDLGYEWPLFKSLFNTNASLYVSVHRHVSMTTRLIKSISSLIGY